MNYIQILYLCILKQRRLRTFSTWLSCELHSNLVSLHSETTTKKPAMHWGSCELHSNLVSLHSETTTNRISRSKNRLWITFKSCIFAFWNNMVVRWFDSTYVVNYIQILYLCILKQPAGHGLNLQYGCELHSNLVSLHSETTENENCRNWRKLWITFKSCIFAFWNN